MRLAPAFAPLIGGLLLVWASLAAHACEEGHWITNVSNDGSVITIARLGSLRPPIGSLRHCGCRFRISSPATTC
jgi:hypothetical protein